MPRTVMDKEFHNVQNHTCCPKNLRVGAASSPMPRTAVATSRTLELAADKTAVKSPSSFLHSIRIRSTVH